MRIPPVLFVIAAVTLALPFGWGLGVVLAYAIAGSDFGQLPAGTVPLAIMASIAFALWPQPSPQTRCAIMAVGTAGFILASLIA
ncbi:MAG TPA: hypothetical protein VFA80_18145 [Xanthobacteraceae bacterium]|jgi:hypothetical protein|nr:hypothetical protein [Xanthobacteraceae bacterium]